MTNRRHQYNNTSHRAMAVTLDSANSDFRPIDMESQIFSKYILEAAAKKKKSDAME